MAAYAFAPALAVSNSHQQRVMAYLTGLGKVIHDERYDQLYQKLGVDFLMDGHTCEFKADGRMHDTGNIAFEIVSNVEKRKPGWGISSEAEYIFYLDTCNDRCHWFNLNGLRIALAQYGQEIWKASKTSTKNGQGDILYSAFCLLVPLEFVKKHTHYGFFVL